MNPIDNKNGQDQHEPDYSGKGKDVLVREGAGSSDPHVRGYALFMLGELKDPELLRYYVDRLRDPDKAVRAQAAAALAGLGEPALETLISLLNDQDWRIRYRAAEAIGLMKQAGGLHSLIEALSDEKDHVRYMAAKGLSQLKSQDAMGPLTDALSDSNEFVRTMAAKALVSIGGRETRNVLEKACRDEKDPQVKQVMEELIAQM
ncbi:MAG TPA: HEAT repeat domain-containing protein [Methanoregulaceae archaeon]|nr:HEAT repeat domain-containing protein [Methanoregulaceae archaeon]